MTSNADNKCWPLSGQHFYLLLTPLYFLSFSQHCWKHTLDLVLTYGTENSSHLATMPHNPRLSDHYPITFNFPLPCNINSLLGIQFPLVLLKLLLDHTVRLMKTPLSYLLTLIWLKLMNLQTAFSSHCAKTLDAVAPLKRKKILAPWYNDHTHALKQALQKLERKWRLTNGKLFFLAWKESLTSYKHALSAARSSYFSTLIEEHKNNRRYLLHTVTSLAKSHASADPCIPATYSSNDFMNFFDTKLKKIRETIQNLPFYWWGRYVF